MSNGVFRRCGCRDANGKTYGVLPESPTQAQKDKSCPKMATDSKHGRWSFRISAGFDPTTKKRRQINGRTYATKREAQTERNKAAALIDRGKVPTVSRETLAEYLPRWLDRRERSSSNGKAPLRASTMLNYRRYAELDIMPSALGAMQLREIRRRHVQAFVDQLEATGRGAVTIRRIVAVVQSCLRSAMKDELLEDFPASNLDLPYVERTEFQPWEPEQVGHFLDVAATHRLGALFELAVLTGLRRHELTGLRWDTDVDLARRELKIRKSKTEAGKRRVALADRAVGALVAWQIAQAAERARAAEAWTDSGFVFTMEDGRPVLGQYVSRLFQTLREEAGLPYMTFHGQRHQAASLRISSEADLVVVSKEFGHADIATTANLYAHLLRSKAHETANNAAALVPARKSAARTVHAHDSANESGAVPASAEIAPDLQVLVDPPARP